MTHNATQPAEPTTGICPCGSPAIAVLTARGNEYRAVTTCGPCESKHRRWVATAGPPQRRPLTTPPAPPDRQEVSLTLF